MSLSTEIIDVPSLRDAQSPESIFKEMAQGMQALKNTAETLVVSDESDVKGMELARETRKGLQAIRLSIDKRRKLLKEDSLRRCQQIEAAAKSIISVIEPLETRLLEAEQFAERAQEVRQRKLQIDRETILRPYGLPPITIGSNNLSMYSEEDFQKLLADTKELHESRLAKAAAEQAAAEAENVRRMDEQVAIRAENEKLRIAAKAEREAREIADTKIRTMEAEALKVQQQKASPIVRHDLGSDHERLIAYTELLLGVSEPILSTPLPAISSLLKNLCAQIISLANHASVDDY